MAKMKMEMEPGEGIQHEKAEGPVYEKKEDVMEGEAGGEEESDGEESDMGMEKDWKSECDANDLMRAAEIKADPARMKAAMAVLQKKKAAIESVSDLKAARNAAFMKKD